MAKVNWSYTTGEKGRNRVRAFADDKTGIYLLEYYEQPLGGSASKRTRISTHHRDRERAKQAADELAARLARNDPALSTELTLQTLFDNYVQEKTPEKSAGEQKHDLRCAEMFLRYFGRNRKPLTLGRRDYDRFVKDRQCGRIAPASVNGEREVGPRVIQHALRWLNAVFNWAVIAGDGRGGVLLQRNPFKGFPLPKEESPRRPMLTEKQYQALRKAAPGVDPLFELLLVLAHETGHRAGSIRLLRWSDVDVERERIHWRGENDKIGFDHWTMLTKTALEALLKVRSGHAAIGEAWVLPAPQNTTQPVSRRTVLKWWTRGEELASIAHEKGLGYHSLRRKFATELKRVPIRDLAYLGGWKCPQTVLTVYQQPDEDTMREALSARTALRAVGQLT